MFGTYTPLTYFFLALGLVAFVVEAWAFIDAITRPSQAFVATGKQTKPLWLIILGVAAVIGLRRSSPPPSTWPTSGRRCGASPRTGEAARARTAPGNTGPLTLGPVTLGC